MPAKLDTKRNVAAFAKQMVAGVEKHLTGVAQVTVLGTTYTSAQITSQLQTIVTLRADVDAAKAVAKAKIAAEKAGTPALRAFMSALVLYVKGAYGNSPDVLADFGIAPKTRVSPKVEDKAAAAVKRAATRVARHTMGSVQKRGVKGAVTGIVVTPIVAPAPVVTGTGTPTVPATSAGPAGATPATSAPSAGVPVVTTLHTA